MFAGMGWPPFAKTRGGRQSRRSGYAALAVALALAATAGAAGPAPATRRHSHTLPPDLQKTVDNEEGAAHRVIAKPERPGKVRDALKAAENALVIREVQQGRDWWETQQTRWLVIDLRILAKATRDQWRQVCDATAGWETYKSLIAKSDWDNAIKVSKQVTETYVAVFGADNPSVVSTKMRTWIVLNALGRPQEALAVAQDALAVCQRCMTGDTPSTAEAMNAVSSSLLALGRPSEALRNCAGALRMLEQIEGLDRANCLRSYENIGNCYIRMGRTAEALATFESALAYSRERFRGDSWETADCAEGYGICLAQLGRTKEALACHLTGLEMRQRLGNGYGFDTARAMDNVAATLLTLHHPLPALGYSWSAYQMRQELDPADSLAKANTLLAIARCFKDLKLPRLARYDVSGAFQMQYRLLDHDSVNFAISLNEVASELLALGKKELALNYLQQSVQIFERHYAEDPIGAGMITKNCGMAAAQNGRWHDSAYYLLKSQVAAWLTASKNFPALPDEQKAAYLGFWNSEAAEVGVGLAVAGRTPASAGFGAALLYKQLLPEVSRQEQGALQAAYGSANPEWRAVWDRRQTLRRQYADLVMSQSAASQESDALAGGAPAKPNAAAVSQQLTQWSASLTEIEQRLRRTNPAYARQATFPMVKSADTQRALGPRQALVEYFVYRPYAFDEGRWQAPRYAAFVVTTHSIGVKDLGDAAVIDLAVFEYRGALKLAISQFGDGSMTKRGWQKSERDLAGIASRLRGLAWAPAAVLLGDVDRIYLAADGQLSIMPFEALASTNDHGAIHYLAEDFEFVYLNTGRDLARLASNPPPASAGPPTAVLVGDPDFSLPTATLVSDLAAADEVRVRGARVKPTAQPAKFAPRLGGEPINEPRRDWQQLPSLAHLVESTADKLRDRGWKVTLLEKREATEEAVVAVRGPTILQFATHGYMLDRPANPAAWDNPLLRSMLVLAGANTWQLEAATYYRHDDELISAADAHARRLDWTTPLIVGNGLLTAYVVTGMDLRNTQLVNLTACETGLGDVTTQGVAGLRQAFLMAGARSLTMSMWQVPADKAPAQIENFYNRWLGSPNQAAEPRYRAFHHAQLDALAQTRAEQSCGHPFFWAGVVYAGDPGDLTFASAATQPASEPATEPAGASD
ncbi:MAG: Photosystem assembly protein Ycf3 [Phycisphaerales bacterium]|nr:Photosystem assembly protein Ycf3 [Phycisphaerales bacterium]